jgi:hypothetical protein
VNIIEDNGNVDCDGDRLVDSNVFTGEATVLRNRGFGEQ